jgi:hypothetical protein
VPHVTPPLTSFPLLTPERQGFVGEVSGQFSPVPAPPIDRGLPVVLALGGLLLGIKLWERRGDRQMFFPMTEA